MYASVEKERDSGKEKENLWQRCYSHLGEGNLRKLAVDEMVSGFDYDVSKRIGFCEPCVSGKHHRSPFPVNSTS